MSMYVKTNGPFHTDDIVSGKAYEFRCLESDADHMLGQVTDEAGWECLIVVGHSLPSGHADNWQLCDAEGNPAAKGGKHEH